MPDIPNPLVDYEFAVLLNSPQNVRVANVTVEACPRWVFPRKLDSAQHPIPQVDGAYEFIIIVRG